MQRIPQNEKRGRVHTSTVVVAVIDVSSKCPDTAGYSRRNPEDFKLEWYSGSGAGGQNRNKTQNCARITHLMSGFVTTCQTRDRESSKRGAMEAMIMKLDQAQAKVDGQALSANRRAQMGSGQRGDKIRTYRNQDNQVTDHRTGKKAGYDKIMRGGFHLLVDVSG